MIRYSTYQAKARFSEIVRKVRSGESVIITYRGREVAEMRPIRKELTVEERLDRLQSQGVITAAADRSAEMKPLARRPGGLDRFLAERD